MGSGRTEASAPTDDKELCASPGAGRCGHRPLRNPIGKHPVGADAHIGPVVPASLLCVGRVNRRSAAGGRCSEPVSRKCPDWRVRQWPGIGWHDGGQESPSPTHHKSAGPPGPALPIFEYKKPRRVCRPQAAKNWDHFSPRHARGEKYLSGCQCGILPPCDKIMRAAACNPLGGKFRRNFRQFSPVI